MLSHLYRRLAVEAESQHASIPASSSAVWLRTAASVDQQHLQLDMPGPVCCEYQSSCNASKSMEAYQMFAQATSHATQSALLFVLGLNPLQAEDVRRDCTCCRRCPPPPHTFFIRRRSPGRALIPLPAACHHTYAVTATLRRQHCWP